MKKILILISLFLIGCNNGAKTPEGLISQFVKDSAKGKVDKEYYQNYSTGALLEASETLSDEEIEEAKIPDLKQVKTKILSKNCSGNSCVITYLVSYSTNVSGKSAFETEVKKIAEVVKEGETWKLAEVKNVKTFHQSLEPINPLKK